MDLGDLQVGINLDLNFDQLRLFTQNINKPGQIPDHFRTYWIRRCIVCGIPSKLYHNSVIVIAFISQIKQVFAKRFFKLPEIPLVKSYFIAEHVMIRTISKYAVSGP